MLTSGIYSSVFWNCCLIFQSFPRMNGALLVVHPFFLLAWGWVFAHGIVVDEVEQLFCVILALIDLLPRLFAFYGRSVACCRHSPPLCMLAIGVVSTFSNFFHDFLLLSFVL